MNTRINKQTIGENIYLNINLINPITSTQQIDALFSKTLQTAVVDNPSDYNLIISRFSIPASSVPIFHFQTRGFPANTNINQGIYSIVIGYNGLFTAPTYLQWVPQTFIPPLITTFSALQPNQDESDTYYFNYSYVNLSNMVSTALQSAIASGSGFLPTGVNAYMIYNPQSGYYSLLGTANMFHSTNPTDPLNVQIYFNTPLQLFFTGFKNIHKAFNSVNGQDELILIENDLNNSSTTQDGFNPNIPIGYYQIQSEFNNDSSLQSLTRILMVSNAFGGVVPQSELNSTIPSSYLNVITDFIPEVSTMNGTYRSKFQYYAGSEFYRRTLTQINPLTTIALDFLFQGRTATHFHHLVLNPGDVLSITFIFEKKK